MNSAKKLYLASSNPGKLREFSAVASEVKAAIDLALLPGFSELPVYTEAAPTFSENPDGKALRLRITGEAAFADDSGLVVALNGEAHAFPHAIRENATSERNIEKLLAALKGKNSDERKAYFVCTLAVARKGNVLAVISDRVDGTILQAPRGSGGFGYDPVFFFAPLNKTFAEVSASEKNLHSHRGKAFRRLLEVLPEML
jgi:XTP/dITP diphosphohydrolase